MDTDHNEFIGMTDDELDPMSDDGNRAEIAERMLDDYHIARTNLAIREAIYNRAVQRRGVVHFVTIEMLRQKAAAQSTLDGIKYEILTLMGVDS